MSTNKLEKIKSIFSSDQKEKLITQDGKRNLYFDRNRQNFIKFSLEVKTTCTSIKNMHKDEINKKLKEIYGEKVNTDNFSFLVVELIANKFDGKIPSVDLKVNSINTRLFNILQNTQLMLCYLPIVPHNNFLKKNSKDLPNGIGNNLLGTDENLYKKKNENKIEVFLPKTIIHFYNDKKKSFSKEKIKVTEKEIYIYAKQDKIILIKDIIKLINTNEADKNEIDNMFKKYIIPGERPKYCIEITTIKNERLLIGRNTLEHFITLSKAIESATTNYKNNYVNNNLNDKTIEQNNDLLSTHKFIAEGCLTINDLIINKDKRKIFLNNFEEKNLADIINNIMEFKSNCKKKKYGEAVNKVKMILEIIKEKMGKEELVKCEKIFNKENIERIEEINNKINNILNENNNKEDENIINKLNKLIDINCFDDIYLQIKEDYLSKYYDENNLINEKKNENFNINNYKIIQNTKLLLGHYFTNIFNINKEKDLLYLGDEKVEGIIKDYNDELEINKLKKYYVFSLIKEK